MYGKPRKDFVTNSKYVNKHQRRRTNSKKQLQGRGHEMAYSGGNTGTGGTVGAVSPCWQLDGIELAEYCDELKEAWGNDWGFYNSPHPWKHCCAKRQLPTDNRFR